MYDAIQACIACYNSYFNENYFDKIYTTEKVWIGGKVSPEHIEICCRGSVTLDDWCSNFKAEMITDSILGNVEAGFMEEMPAALQAISAYLSGYVKLPVYISGHSRGAAHALLLAGMLSTMVMDIAVYTFGSPRPGGHKLKEILSQISIESYRNNNDPVTQVPFNLPDEDYCHPGDLIQIYFEGISPDGWLALKDHHIQNYMGALVLQEKSI